LYFVGDHRKASTGITGHRCLNSGVQGENVGLVGNIVDQRYDVANFL
jgi:hypothetical protein